MTISVRFPGEPVFRALVGVATALVLIHVGLQTYHARVHQLSWLARDLFDLDEENNVPAWFAAALMLLAALLLALIAGARARERAADARHWRWLAVGFVALSLAKDASLTDLFESAAHGLGAGWLGWPIAAAIAAAAVGVAYARFLVRLPPPDRRGMVIAGVLYLTGTLAMESLARVYLQAAASHTPETLTFNLITAGKQTLELAGLLVLIRTLLALMRRTTGEGAEIPLALEIRP